MNASVIEIEYRRQIEVMEAQGSIDPTCAYCRREFYSAERPADVFAPRHRAMPGCASGSHPHCTCDACF